MDRSSLTGMRDAGKSRVIPDAISFIGGRSSIRAEWPSAFASHYESKCNRSFETAERISVRLAVLQARGHREQVDKMVLGMTLLLQALASLAVNKGMGADRIPTEALKSLD